MKGYRISNGPWRRFPLMFVSLATILAVPRLQLASQQTADQDRPIVVGSKPFAESYLLAELFSQVLEADGFQVDRRFGMGATELLFQGLRSGEIDVYPEYTGTGLLAVLGRTHDGDRSEVFSMVERAFREQWGIRWLPPLGFENTYAIAIRQTTQDSLNLRTLSDLALRGADLVGGFSPDFLGRADGLPGLADVYDLSLSETRSLLQSVKYRALVEGQVDVVDGYSTDGSIDRFSLAVLEDDREFFPPYDAAALLSSTFYREDPSAVRSLSALSGLLTVDRVRQANRRIETDGDPVEAVASELLATLGLGSGSTVRGVAPDRGVRRGGLAALPTFLWGRRSVLGSQTTRHLFLVVLSLAAATLVAVPLGVYLVARPAAASPTLALVGLLQTVPGIALLAFMIPLFGIGTLPAVFALFIYSLLPILRNTYAGVSDADPEAVQAGVALGMTEAQVLGRIRLPLAAPIIMAGIRTAAVINVGTATLAAFIGAGGLGDPIVAGLALSDPLLILSGAVPAALLALVVDLILGRIERSVTPRGLR